MKNSTKRLCRAGVIAALYAVITYAFTPFAFGPFQIRPAEALCILPLFFVEAVPALAIGCFLSNLASPYLVYDLSVGTTATLLAAFISYLVGRFCKKDGLKLFLGGLAPVLVNAILLPFVIVIFYGGGEGYSSLLVGYSAVAGSILLTESVWVYALGAPLYFSIKKILY